RNPWAEIECGHRYARGMSAHALLHAAAGLHYNAADASLSMNPKLQTDAFRCFFSAAAGWGTLSQTRENGTQTNSIALAHGAMPLKRLTVGIPEGANKTPTSINLGSSAEPVKASIHTEGS